ncbi:hypothetical protein [Rhizohabitans arisaemae]|uniref:hypothetical protein n=1 Tax=Rhizohabitans arisaemae TaxID=2720610 RepID=UPI0024B17E18|nr:hypothetical protein [Rhizohabitans arisaemae]
MAKTERHAVSVGRPPRLMKWLMRVFDSSIRKQIREGTGGRSTDGLILLRFTGRRSGKPYEIPVMKQNFNGRAGVFSDSLWRVNFRGGAEAETIERGVRSRVWARLEEDTATLAAMGMEMIERSGLTELGALGLTVHVDRAPTLEEIADALARHRVAIVFLEPRADQT